MEGGNVFGTDQQIDIAHRASAKAAIDALRDVDALQQQKRTIRHPDAICECGHGAERLRRRLATAGAQQFAHEDGDGHVASRMTQAPFEKRRTVLGREAFERRVPAPIVERGKRIVPIPAQHCEARAIGAVRFSRYRRGLRRRHGVIPLRRIVITFLPPRQTVDAIRLRQKGVVAAKPASHEMSVVARLRDPIRNIGGNEA